MMCVAACNLSEDETIDPVFCTEEAVAGLEITVRSSASSDFLIDGITVVARDNDYIETLKNIINTTTFSGAIERTGIYTITVQGIDYESFTFPEPIVVESDECHVITESREIKLASD